MSLFLQAQLVCLDTEATLLQPFKDKMDDFFETGIYDLYIN